MRLVVLVILHLPFLIADECQKCDHLPTWHAEACFPGTIVSDSTYIYQLSWSRIDKCCEEESNTEPPATGLTNPSESTFPTGYVSCQNIYKWSPYITYETGNLVHLDKNMFKAIGTSLNHKPGKEDWDFAGICLQGTDSLDCDPDANDLGLVGEERLCACCEACAARDDAMPRCMDGIERENCYDTWCSKFSKITELSQHSLLDPDNCKDVVENQKLLWWGRPMGSRLSEWDAQIVAPYVDVTVENFEVNLTESVIETGTKVYVLAFLRANDDPEIAKTTCDAFWGGVWPIEKGPHWEVNDKTIHLYDEIRNVRDAGGDVLVSLGGNVGRELTAAAACKGSDAVEKVYRGYKKIVDILNVSGFDFNIQGDDLSSLQMSKDWPTRFAAIKKLVAEYPHLKIWWTFPADGTSGFTWDTQIFIDNMIGLEIPLDRINMLNMNYGLSCRIDFHTCEQNAIDSVAQYLFTVASDKYGWTKWQDAYKILGSTPMIGLNDQSTLQYTLTDALAAVDLYQDIKPLGLISYWDLNRDRPCEESTQALPTCSGASLQTQTYDYAKIFQKVAE